MSFLRKAENLDARRVQEAGSFAGRYTGVCIGAGLKGLFGFGKGIIEGATSNSVAEAKAKAAAAPKTDLSPEE